MLAQWLMLLPAYYAQNYAGIIGASLVMVTATLQDTLKCKVSIPYLE